MSYLSRNKDLVRGLFSQIAPRYDLMNNLMSCGMHHYWNRCLINALSSDPKKRLLDLCAGTGAIAQAYIQKINPSSKVVLLDFCDEMLSIAKIRLTQKSKTPIDFLCADACQIPLENQSIDSITLAYGLRNIIDIEKAASEMYRVLDDGGRVAIVELTRPKNYFLKKFHYFWLKYIVATLASYCSEKKEAYFYLQESIAQFVDPDIVIKTLKKNGFINVSCKPLTGQIASLFTAEKPLK